MSSFTTTTTTFVPIIGSFVAEPQTTIIVQGNGSNELATGKRVPRFLSLADFHEAEEAERSLRLSDEESELRRQNLARQFTKSIASDLAAATKQLESDPAGANLLKKAGSWSLRSILFFGQQAVEGVQVLGSNALSDVQNLAGKAVASAQIFGSMAIDKVQTAGFKTVATAQRLNFAIADGLSSSEDAPSLGWNDLELLEDRERLSRTANVLDPQRFMLARSTSSLIQDAIRERSKFFEPQHEPGHNYGSAVIEEMERLRRIKSPEDEKVSIKNARKVAWIISDYRQTFLAEQKGIESRAERAAAYDVKSEETSNAQCGLARAAVAAH